MAQKSAAQSEAEKVTLIEDQLNELETTIDRLKSMYEQYFLGIQKSAPAFLHNDVERRLRDLQQMNIRRTAQRYKMVTLQQKFGSYNAYWRRTLREIESGKYIRNLSKIGREAVRSGAEIPEEILNAMPKRMRESVIKDREAALALAKRRDKKGGGDFATEEATDADAVLDIGEPEPPPEDELAAVIREPTALRRSLKPAPNSPHRLTKEDEDFDLDAFFAQVQSQPDPPPAEVKRFTTRPSRVTGPQAPQPPQRGKTPSQELPVATPAPMATQPGVARLPSRVATPVAGTPRLQTEPRPGTPSGEFPAQISEQWPADEPRPGPARLPQRRTSNQIAAQPPPPEDNLPSGVARLPLRRGPGQSPIPQRGSQPIPVQEPTADDQDWSIDTSPRAQPLPGHRTTAAGVARPTPPAQQRPSSPAVPPATPPQRPPPTPAQRTQAMPPVPPQRPSQPIAPLKPTSTQTMPGVQPPQPPRGVIPPISPTPTGGMPRVPAAPSQRTRPLTVQPGATTSRPEQPVESISQPLRRPPPRPASEPAAPLRPPPGMSDADVNALHANYIKAKQMVGEDAGPGSRDKLLRTINAQAPKIMDQYKVGAVDFSVVVKDNQVIIRAKPKGKP